LSATCEVPATSLAAATMPPQAPTGTLKPITLPNANGSYVWNAINDSDQVAGEVLISKLTSRPARWQNGVTTTFTTGASANSGAALAIDQAGGLFGAVLTAGSPPGYPALWSPSGALTTLSSAAGSADVLNITLRAASNNGNVVAGITSNSDGGFPWFYALAPSYKPIILDHPTPAAPPPIYSVGVNNAGHVAVGDNKAPYLLVNGVHRPLKVEDSSPFDLNDNDDVAGTLVPVPTSGSAQAAIELANGTVQVLPPLHPGDTTIVRALNDHDEAVGLSGSTAVAWINGKVVPVTSLIAGSFSPTIINVLDANNNGSILAEGTSPNGATVYYLLASTGTMVSGYVQGTSCNTNGCFPPAGVGGFTVLVKGTATNGTAVSETDLSSDDGSWSVRVPPGSYTAGLSADGSSFVAEAMEKEITVGGVPLTGVNFTSCAEGSGEEAEPADQAVGAGSAREAAEQSSASYCESQYQVTVTAKIPQDIIVDASEDSHYQEASGPGYNHSTGFLDTLRQKFRKVSGFNAEFPECMALKLVHAYNDLKATPEWYSYIKAGTVIGSATVPLRWNQSTQQVEPEGSPILTHGSVTRWFVWQVSVPGGGVQHGSCPEKVQVPMLLTPAIGPPGGEGGAGLDACQTSEAERERSAEARSFTIIAAWWFPFDSYGATIDPNTTWAESVVDGTVKLTGAFFTAMGKEGHDLVEGYERLPAYQRFLVEAVVGAGLGLAEEKVAVEGTGLFAKWLTQYYKGRNLTLAELEQLERIGSVMKVVEYGYKIPLEAASVIEGYTAYPVMSAVIRGQFTTTKCLPSSYATPVGKLMPYQETLGISMQTTKFPNISLRVSRDALQAPDGKVYEGSLPWNSQRSAPETFNPFSQENPAYVITNSAKTGHSYTRGLAAVRSLVNDTNQLPAVAYSIRNKGNLGSGFAAEQAEAPEPGCNAEEGRATTAKTICWVFEDTRP
jgi:hypothetical protein